MPTYEYTCPACGAAFDAVKPMSASQEPEPCPSCGASATRVPSLPARVAGDAFDWSFENNGKGRRISQLDRDSRTPYYAKSQRAAIDEAHRRGLHATKA